MSNDDTMEAAVSPDSSADRAQDNDQSPVSTTDVMTDSENSQRTDEEDTSKRTVKRRKRTASSKPRRGKNRSKDELIASEKHLKGELKEMEADMKASANDGVQDDDDSHTTLNDAQRERMEREHEHSSLMDDFMKGDRDSFLSRNR